MPIAQIFVAFLLASAAINAEAGFPFMSKTVSWNEDVLRSDGGLLSVSREITYGPDEWGRSGRGLPKAQTISFSYKGRQVEWENDDLWPIARPAILDFASGGPVLVMPVQGWKACDKYGFPPEGLVAFGFQNGRWGRITVATLPKELKVNLLRTGEYTGTRITPAIKPGLERGNWESLKQGQSITEASRFYAGGQDSCAHIRPQPNPLQEAAKQRVSEAETRPQALVATITSSSDLPVNISPADFRKVKGSWTGQGYLAENCGGIVDKIEPIRQYREGGAWSLVGHTLVLRNGSNVPLQQPYIKGAQAPALLQSVTCDNRTIYALRRQGISQLSVLRFTRTGSIIDALHITLPGVTKYFPGEKWPMIWETLPANGHLSISIANYSYSRTADMGGILDQQVSYTAQLPE